MSKMKYILLIMAAVLVLVSLLMLCTTSFYAAYYPHDNVTLLPQNYTTVSLSIFNSYTEKVANSASNSTQALQSANSETQSTIFYLTLAFFMVGIYYYLLKRATGKDNWRLPAWFIVSLIVSQYLFFVVAYMEKKVMPSGTSLFFVDSLITIISFSILMIIWAYVGISRTWKLKMLRTNAGKAAHVILMSLTIIALIFLVAIAAINLLNNTNVNDATASSVIISQRWNHIAGIFIFSWLFLWFYYVPSIRQLLLRLRTFQKTKPAAYSPGRKIKRRINKTGNKKG